MLKRVQHDGVQIGVTLNLFQGLWNEMLNIN